MVILMLVLEMRSAINFCRTWVMQTLGFACGFIVFVGCTTSYSINSTPPGAEVDIVTSGGARKNLGKTPLKLENNELVSYRDGVQLVVNSKGYYESSIFVPQSSLPKVVDVQVILKPQSDRPKDESPAEANKKINEVAASVADIQRDISKKAYDLAVQKINKMLALYPSISVYYILLGNIGYLQHKNEDALIYYRKAKEIDPSSTELTVIIEKLQGTLGGRR